MTTWSRKGEENVIHGASLPGWVEVGGDSRWIVPDEGRPFWMHKDLEAAVMPFEGITLVGSVGLYGRDSHSEFRRTYLKVQPIENVYFRFGRFIPAYGVNFPDHTLPTRFGLGLGQGSETYNAEAALVTKWGEVLVSGVYGKRASVVGTDGDGFVVVSGERSGGTVRSAFYLGDRTQVGFSLLKLGEQTALGAHVITAADESLYFLAEYDRNFEFGEATDLAVAKLGWEYYRGVHFGPTLDRNGDLYGFGIFSSWFPRPHFELLAQAKRSFSQGEASNSGALMFHYFL